MMRWTATVLLTVFWSSCADFSVPPQQTQYGPYIYNKSNPPWSPPIYYPDELSRQSFAINQRSRTYSRDNRYDPQYADLVSSSVLGLAHKLGQQVDNNGSANAQIFSPLSIASALSLLLLGAKGKTHQELVELFDLDLSSLYVTKPYKFHEEFGLMMEDIISNDIENANRVRSQPLWKNTHANDFLSSRGSGQMRALTNDDHQVEIANAIFIQNGFSLRPDYKSVVDSVYKSEFTPLNFHSNGREAQNYINQWVNQKTHGKIPSIITEEINADTNMIIANALYFKALWEKEFLEGGTVTSEFYPDGLDGRSLQIQMMANGGVFPFYDATVEYDCRIVGLPYRRNLSTMYIIMPNDSTRSKLRMLQSSLTADKIEYMISKMTKKTAIIAVPKLHVQNSLHLKSALVSLGVRTIFNKGNSDLSLIANEAGGLPQDIYQHSQQIITETPFIFTRIGDDVAAEDAGNMNKREKRTVNYKVESSVPGSSQPLRLKDLILNKRITKPNPGKKRTKRQVLDPVNKIRNLDNLRQLSSLKNPQLFVEDIVHKIDLVVNERGTEGGAATVAYLRRSGPEVLFRADTPFMILVRHDPTKLPLFYGTIYEPIDF